MGSCDLYMDNHVIGRVTWEKSGDDWIIRAGCGFEDGVIYRAFIAGSQGQISLGVMEPKGDRFALRKPVRQRSASWLETSDDVTAWVTRSLPGEASPPPVYKREGAAFPVPDTMLKSACEKTEGVTFERSGGQTYLYYPLNIGEESAFAPFFAITKPVTRDGKSYGCIRVDGSGRISPGGR